MRYLIHFLDEWLDFRYAEFLSLLSLQGLDARKVILTHNRQAAIDCVTANAGVVRGDDYVMDTIDCGIASLRLNPSSEGEQDEKDKELLNTYIQYLREKDEPEHFMIVELPNDDSVKTLCSRAVLIKSVYELWSYNPHSLPQLIDEVAHTVQQDPSIPHFLTDYLSVDKNLSWSVQVLTFGKTFTMQEKEQVRLQFKPYLTFPGPVQIRTPQIEVWIVLNYQGKPDYSRKAMASLLRKKDGSSEDVTTTPATNNDDHDDVGSDNEMEEEVLDCQNIQKPAYLGRKVTDNTEIKKIQQKYDLKKRVYLGPTSLDDALALILCNIAGVSMNMMAYEPFIGTGSIAIALEHFGSWVIGSDIDPRVLRGDMYAGKDVQHLEKNKQYYHELNEQRKKEREERKKRIENGVTANGGDSVTATATTVPETALSEPTTTETMSATTQVTTTDLAEAGLDNIHRSTRKLNSKSLKNHNKDLSCQQGRDVFANFEAYHLPLPDLIRMDHHLLDRHFVFEHNSDVTNADNTSVNSSSSSSTNTTTTAITTATTASTIASLAVTTDSNGFFDVIVTDPPYGIRAGARKSGRKEGVHYKISEEKRYDHIPSTQNYPVEEVMLDLLHTAASTMVM